jgi:hypothetical protein
LYHTKKGASVSGHGKIKMLRIRIRNTDFLPRFVPEGKIYFFSLEIKDLKLQLFSENRLALNTVPVLWSRVDKFSDKAGMDPKYQY